MAHRPKRLDGSYALMIAGPGVAPGGLEGQLLRKATDADYDTYWSWFGFISIIGSPYDNEALSEALNQKSNVGHTHDDRYYNQTEVDNIFANFLTTIEGLFAPMLLVPDEISTTAYDTTADDKYVAKLCMNAALTTITLTEDSPVGARVRVKAMTAAGFIFAAGPGMEILSREDALASPGQYAVAEAWRINETQWSILGDVE